MNEHASGLGGMDYATAWTVDSDTQPTNASRSDRTDVDGSLEGNGGNMELWGVDASASDDEVCQEPSKARRERDGAVSSTPQPATKHAQLSRTGSRKTASRLSSTQTGPRHDLFGLSQEMDATEYTPDLPPSIGQSVGSYSLSVERAPSSSAPSSSSTIPLGLQPVVVVDRDSGKALRYYESVKEAAVRLGVSKNNILNVCQHWSESSNGFGWRFALLEEQEQGGVEEAVSEEELKRMLYQHVRGASAGPVLADKPVVVMDRASGKALRYFESVTEAAVRLGLSKNNILNVCQHWSQSSNGFGWRFALLEEQEQGGVKEAVSVEELKRMLYQHVRGASAGPVLCEKPVVVVQVDSGKALRYFESVTEAAVRLGVLKNNILNVCQKRQKAYKGFGWRFARLEEQEQGVVEEVVSEEELNRILQQHVSGASAGPVLADKPVMVVDRNSGKTLRYYESVKEAAVRLGLLKNNILNVCQKRQKAYKGFGWRFARLAEQEQGCVEEEVSDEDLEREIREYISVKGASAGPMIADAVVVLDMVSGKVVRYYESVKEAAIRLGVLENSILHVCQNWSKSSSGFGWRFASLEEQEQEQGGAVEEVSDEELKRRLRNMSALVH